MFGSNDTEAEIPNGVMKSGIIRSSMCTVPVIYDIKYFMLEIAVSRIETLGAWYVA